MQVNFDGDYFAAAIPQGLAMREALKNKVAAASEFAPVWTHAAAWSPDTSSTEALEAACAAVGVLERQARLGEEPAALHELITYGIKGAAAYACHAMEAGVEKDAIYSSLHDTLAMLGRSETNEATLVAEAMKVGANGVAILAALDGAHTSKFGAPTPTAVNHAAVAGKVRISLSFHSIMYMYTC